MSLSTCGICGGHIPLGPYASNRCEKCGAGVFGPSEPMSKCPNNHCGERHSYVPKGTTHYVCEWCHQAQPDPEIVLLRARVEELEAAKTPRPLDDYHEDMGTVLWWRLPVEEPPYVGTPMDSDWPGYHTHWTPIITPNHDRSHC